MDISDIDKELTKSISEHGLSVAGDIAEIGIDKILDEGILKEIPFVGIVKSIVGAGLAIRERRFLKNILLLLKAIRDNKKDDHIYKEYLDKYQKDESFKSKVNEGILLFCDKNESDRKAVIAGRLTEGLMAGSVQYSEYESLLFSISALNPAAIDHFTEICRDGFQQYSGEGTKRVYELENYLLASGLVQEANEFASTLIVNPVGKTLFATALDS